MSDRPAAVTVNGVDTGTIIDFSPTGHYSSWDDAFIQEICEPRINTLRLTALTSAGLPILDKLDIVYETEFWENIYEVEQYGSISGNTMQIETEQPGYSGWGYVKSNMNSIGIYLDMIINRDVDEYVKLVYYYYIDSEHDFTPVSVNGILLNEALTFSQSANPSEWTTRSIKIHLYAGKNIIRLYSTSIQDLPA